MPATPVTPVRPFRMKDEYLSRPELARELNRTVRSLQMWERKHIGPNITRVGREPYYAHETVRSWLADQERRGWPDVPKAGQGD